MLSGIHAEATDQDVSIWWEPPVSKAEDVMVAFQGKRRIAVNHHIEFEHLEADTAYTCMLNDEPFTFHTLPLKRRIDITKEPYLAVSGQVCTEMLQKALDDCDADSTVYLPHGVYLSGALNMHSNTSLYLEKGAVLQGTEDPDDYGPRILSRFEGTERMCYRSLLNLGTLDHAADPNCSNILIYGHGEIRGGGYALAVNCADIERASLQDYLASHPEEVASCENANTIPFRCRGRLINMSNCKNIRITGLTLGYGPSWNIHMIYSRNIVTDHCLIQSDGVWNGDGWDPDSSENCTIYACTFKTGDDAVAIKSGKNPEGCQISRPARHIRIFDCISEYGHGICIGSEMSGGVEDVVITDCSLAKTECGIEIKTTKKRGGYVRNISAARCLTSHVQIHSVSFNDDGISASSLPILEDFHFFDLRITGRYYGADEKWYDCSSIVIQGLDAAHPVKNCIFKNTGILQKNDLPETVVENCEGYQNA